MSWKTSNSKAYDPEGEEHRLQIERDREVLHEHKYIKILVLWIPPER